MLVKANHVIGLKVITINTGKEAEKVDDILYDPKTQHVQALVVKPKGVFSDGQVIPIDQVKNIGPDAVIVESDQVFTPMKDLDPQIKHLADSDTHLTKSTVMTETGTNLGKVTDLIFDPATGQVEELEVSQGGLNNLKSGKKHVKPNNIVTVGEDALIVDRYTEEKFDQEAQTGGLTGAANQAKIQAQQTAEQAKQTWQSDDVQSKLDQTKINLKAAAATAKEQLQQATTQAQQKVQEAQQDPDNQAKLADAKAKIKQAADTTQQTIQQKQADMEQNREDAAVGQYLTQNLLGNDDEILALRGHMVTHQLIEVAKQQDKLDVLLNNLSKEPVELV